MSSKDYLRKNVTFSVNNEEEMELYKWLQSKPYGVFAEGTKEYWMKKMKEEKENGK